MKNLSLILSILLGISKQCSVTPGFKFASFSEQATYAGGIFIGKVKSVSNRFNANVTLTDIVHYRGCAGSGDITVSGFVDGATCGSGIPSIGDKIIVFVCETDQFPYVKVN